MVDEPTPTQQRLYLEYTDFGLARKNERHVSDDEVIYAIENAEQSYRNGNNIVYRATLPDGRKIKVQKMAASENPAYIIDVLILH